MGAYGKGETNSNGEFLLDLARKQELVLSNTLFCHKMAHRTTWVCPQRTNEHKDKNGQIRRNPYRNQIDYVLIKNEHRQLIQNSRSYSGINTNTDHRLVITTIKLTWHKVFNKNEKTIKYNPQLLREKATKEAFTKTAEQKYEQNKTKTVKETAQTQWNNITQACLEAAKEHLKAEKKQLKSENPEIVTLSNTQKKLRNDINAITDKNKIKELKTERNRTLKKIHKLIEAEKTQKILEQVEEIENSKDDSNRMYKAVRQLQQSKPKKKLAVDGENGLTINAKEQVEIITKHFKSVFHADSEKEIPEVKPTEMTTPFTVTEVQKAVKSLKNNKSAGCDDLKAELIKHSPENIHQGIADLLNHMAKTGEHPKEVKEGILIPLPKPGKKQGPPQNLRPIILLSIIRKILAIIMIRRCANKLNSKIPITQAAYRPGRGTTEHVFTIKTLAEKAITSSQYKLHILLLDMSKAFDTIQRDVLMEDLKEVLDPDELHMFYLLLKDVKIKIRVGEEMGEEISTNIGAPQGDCASAILFTFYLAKSLQIQRQTDEEEHNYAKAREETPAPPEHLQDHTYTRMHPNRNLTIDQQYADDIGWATTNKETTENIKKTVPQKLKDRNLTINIEKTEEYTITRDGPEEWKRCKYLGSLIDTEEDIKRRTGLAISTYNQLKHILNSRKTSIAVKMRIFDAYVCSVFLYNCELWTPTTKIENKVDVLQRSFLRKIANVKKLDKVPNQELYKRTKCKTWSTQMKRRRLNWFGHLLRLPKETPARQALTEYNRQTKRPVGRPKPTWVAHAQKEIKTHSPNLTLFEIETLANDRGAWRAWVARAMAIYSRNSVHDDDDEAQAQNVGMG